MAPRQTIELRSRVVGHAEVPPDQLLAHELNFRRHPGSQLDALRGSLRDLGWVKSILVNQATGKVIDGHARVEEALRQGAAMVPVEYVSLTEEEERLALALLDPISEMARRDDQALAGLLSQVTTDDPALLAVLAEMGKGVETAALPDADPDEAPEPRPGPVTRSGDLIVLGRHRLICGDSREPGVWDALLGGKTADMVWTDPPYGFSLEAKVAELETTKGRKNGQYRRARAIQARGQSHIENDDLSVEELEVFLRDVFAMALAHSRPGAAWYVSAPSNTPMLAFAKALHEIDIWRTSIIWAKDRFVMGRSDYHSQHEFIFYGWKPGAAHRALEDRSQGNVWQIDHPKKSPDHPTTKPVALVERAIRNSSRPGEIVVDCFGGSGTTLVAAETSGRDARLIELDPIYCDVIVSRWEKLTGLQAERPVREDEMGAA